MRFSAAAVLAFAATTLAQTPDFDAVYSPKKDEIVTAGSALNLTWDAPAKYDSGIISIELIGGATQNTQTHIANIASGVKNSAKTYIWHIDASLGGQNVYGLVFKLESDPKIFQYSNPFHIKAPGGKTSSGDATSQATSTVRPSTTTASVSTASLSATPVSMTPGLASHEPLSTFVTKTDEFTTTVPCTTNGPHSTGNQSAPADSVAPTASNPVMTGTSTHGPLPTNGAAGLRVGSFSVFAVAAAYLLL
ncbi:hypothetical protein E4U42_006954 [Claviceps africana]|uniref:Yeast cell wall synthesis Kre9/Knh1-like N-terminal domain-containing protein n=1 Tax=Claviceps africana TaxID=83212 RepID=A0A8K0J2L1_9HYPO|nr:hypothetical protein E4U42_006954 [Claviceps africana]